MAYVVEVDMSAVAYHAVNGAPPSDDLSKVIASRERKDLERVLDSARVEELEAALVRARTALAEKGAPAPCQNEPTPRRSRL